MHMSFHSSIEHKLHAGVVVQARAVVVDMEEGVVNSMLKVSLSLSLQSVFAGMNQGCRPTSQHDLNHAGPCWSCADPAHSRVT